MRGKPIFAKKTVTTIPLPPPIYPSSLTSGPRSSSSGISRSRSTKNPAPSTTRATTAGSTSSITIKTFSMPTAQSRSSTRTSTALTTTTSTSRSSQTMTSTSTGNRTTTDTVVPGGQCSASAEQFYCMNGNTLARCIFGRWVGQACPKGLVCVDGSCVWSLSSPTALPGTSLRTMGISITTTTTIFTTRGSSKSSTTASTSTSPITPGGSCSASADQFFCADGRKVARCVFNQWKVHSCPVGLVCVKGYCVWPSLRAPARLPLRRSRRE